MPTYIHRICYKEHRQINRVFSEQFFMYICAATVCIASNSMYMCASTECLVSDSSMYSPVKYY